MEKAVKHLRTNKNKRNRFDLNLERCVDDIDKSLSYSCRENLNEYLNNSSLHGLNYAGDRTISRGERFFFALTFLSVTLLSIFFISIAWIKWSEKPIIISLSSKAVSVSEMPFPAVTVCNMNQVRRSEAIKFPKDSLQNYVVRSLCRKLFSDQAVENDTKAQSVTWDVYKSTLLQVAPSCNEVLLYCDYGGLPFNCSYGFNSYLTDDGLCCTFNAIHKKFVVTTEYNLRIDGNETSSDLKNDWSVEKGYGTKDSSKDKSLYPRPGVGSGNELGLTLILKAFENDYKCSTTNSYGFKVLLHGPHELPRLRNYGKSIAIGYESRFVIVPTLSQCSSKLRKLSPTVRQCLYEDENFLSFYHMYSQKVNGSNICSNIFSFSIHSTKNCISECETKLLHEFCKCVMYYQPRENVTTSICGFADMPCVNGVVAEMGLQRTDVFKCSRCLVGCSETTYDATYSRAKIFNNTPFLLENNLTRKNVSILHVYYARSSFRSERKEEFIGFTDFLSNIGGLLGLFMGFSLISLVEIFYFISIRPFCNYLRFSKLRREIKAQMLRKLQFLTKKRSPFVIKTVEARFDTNNPHPYLD